MKSLKELKATLSKHVCGIFQNVRSTSTICSRLPETAKYKKNMINEAEMNSPAILLVTGTRYCDFFALSFMFVQTLFLDPEKLTADNSGTPPKCFFPQSVASGKAVNCL